MASRLSLAFLVLYLMVGHRSRLSQVSGEVEDFVKYIEVRRSSSPIKTTAKSLIDELLNYAKSRKGSPLPPRVDLVLILDSSSAVGGQRNFESLRTFAYRVVNEFSVSPSTTRVGLILCSTNPHLQFGLNKFVNRECTLKAIKNVRYLHGAYCSLTRALDMTRRVLFKKHYQNAKRLVFVLSAVAGRGHRDGFRAMSGAEAIKRTGADVFLLRVGEHAMKEDKWIASELLKLHRFTVRDYNDVMKLSEKIKDKGFDRSCVKGVVYDECRRRCQCSDGRMVNCYRIRKDFPSMSLEERRLYIHALKTASTVQPYKRIYDEITSYHPRWFKEVHQLEYFFPWHRWYILEFENFLRQIDCRVTVPYWDWSRAVTSGTLWRASHIRDVWHPGSHGLGGNGRGEQRCVWTGPFSKDSWSVCFILKGKMEFCLSREFNSCYSKRLPTSDKVRTISNLPHEEFERFEKVVREYMHDDFHNSIGGVMSFEESANAPEFWFHHGYLDKLWGDWQRRGYSFKHQYFHGVASDLPGANISGSIYIDLERQPMCVKVIQEQPIEIKDLKDEFDESIENPVPVHRCYHRRS